MFTVTDCRNSIKNAIYEFKEIPKDSNCKERRCGFCPFKEKATAICVCGLNGMIENGCVELIKPGEAVD